MSNENQEILKVIMSIASMPIALEEKKALLLATRDAFSSGVEDNIIFNKYIDVYTDLIAEAKKRSNEMIGSFMKPQCVPC
jgi:hypothetical protein